MGFPKIIFQNIFLKLFFVLSFFLSKNTSAQFYQVRNFNSESGLPSSEVYGMLQDSKGYMWFATDMGVSRYNGYEFKNFSTENGLPDNSVFGFFEDAKKKIWFRSFSGKLSFFLNDSIHIVNCNEQLAAEIKSHALILVSHYVDEGDTVWLGTTDKFVIKISPPYNNENISFIKLPNEGAYLFLLNQHSLVFGGSPFEECVVTVYKKNTAIMTKLKLDRGTKKIVKHRYFGRRLQNGNFLASVDNFMFEFNSKGIVRSFEINATIIEMIQDLEKNIICASSDGVCFHDADNFALAEMIPGFSDKNFTGVLIDRENALWLSAEGHGVFYIPYRSGRYYTTEHGLPQSKISSIGQKNGKIITGHLNGSVSVIKGNEIKNSSILPGKNTGSSSNRINCVFTERSSEVFAANNFFTVRLSGENFETSEILNVGGAKKIIHGKENLIWLNRDRHIILCDGTKKFKPLKEIIFNQYVDDIFEDSHGILWISGLNGLWNYYNDSLHYLGEKNKLLSSRITQILEDQKGRLWMATRGEGLIIKEGKKFFQIKDSDGLASNMCRGMFIDSNNVVWAGSNNGLSRIEMRKEIENDFTYGINVYTSKNGLLTNEVNYILRRGNELVIAHNNGISIFNPSTLKNNSSAPPVYIVNTTINNRSYKENSLNLNYSRNYLKINYVGISFKNPGSVEYKYKMEGLDTSWVYTKYTSAQFQTLSPGVYKFIVYAKNDDGYWSSRPAVLQLEILPAWWQTWLFRIFSGTILFAVCYYFVKKRISKIQKREHEKNTLQNNVAAAELKALRAQMNPHFVFNAINSVQHFITSNDPDSSQRYLSKFAKLIRYVVDNSKPTAIPLEKEIEAITLFMDIEALRFEDRFEYEITLDKKIDPTFVHIPSMLIQPYIENAIWHGLMHKKGKGKIKVDIEMIDQLIKCTVEDNGVGRKKSLEFKSTQNFKTHKSVGMTITQERLELINQMNNSKLSVRITDLGDENGNGLGTRVELFIPSH